MSTWGNQCSPIVVGHTHTQSCVRCILRTSYCSPLLFPLLLDLNFFRHLPLDLYTFFNRGHLLTITANRGPIVPLCYMSSVYPLDTLMHTHTHVSVLQCLPLLPFLGMSHRICTQMTSEGFEIVPFVISTPAICGCYEDQNIVRTQSP